MNRQPKRATETDFLTPSRVQTDSVMANSDEGGSFQRAVEEELRQLRQYLNTLEFRKGRETGYADKRSSQDLVIDTNLENTDQKLIDQTGYLKNQDPSLLGAKGYGRNGGTFSMDEKTLNQSVDEGMEAARRMLVEAEGASAQHQAELLAEISESYPWMMTHDKTAPGRSPIQQLAEAYSSSMNANTLAGQRRAKRQNSTKKTQTFY